MLAASGVREVSHGVHGLLGAVCPGRRKIAILARNAFLVPCAGRQFVLAPFCVSKLTAGGFKRMWPQSWKRRYRSSPPPYLRTENFQQAVEENVRYLHHPVRRCSSGF